MIAIYIGNELENHRKKIVQTMDFIFRTLGYEYRFIRSPEDLNPQDVILFYSQLDVSIREAEYLAYNHIMINIPVETFIWEVGSYGFKKISSTLRKIKLFSPIPVLSESPIEFYVQNETSQHVFMINFGFDLVSNIFFHLSGYFDLLNYFTELEGNEAYPNPFEEFSTYPFLNGLLYILDKSIEEVFKEKIFPYSIIKKDFWPEGQTYAVAISHSVDRLRKWNAGNILSSFFEDLLIFYRVNYVFKNFISKMKYLLTNDEEYWNFKEIIQIERMHFVKSTYFLGADIQGEENFDYNLDDPDTQNLISSLVADSYDIGLLASKPTAHKDIFKAQLSRLQKVSQIPIIGLRIQDYEFDIQKTSQLFNKNSLFCDSTFGYKNKNGFKRGIGFPFEILYYDLTNQEMGIDVENASTVEIPTVFRDENLKVSKYKNVSYEHSVKMIDNYLRNMRTVNGLISFDFSVANFADIDYDFDLFEHLLRKLLAQKPYVGTYSDISIWWKKRNTVHITEIENSFIIYFPEELKKFTFYVYGDVEKIKIEGADFIRDPLDEYKFTLEDIERNSKVYVLLP